MPTVIILAGVGLTMLFAYQQVTEDLVSGKNRELARLSAIQVSNGMQDYTNLLSTLAQNPDIRLGIDTLQGIALSRAKGELTRFDAGVYILDSQGRVNAVEGAGGEVIGQDWAQRSYVQSEMTLRTPRFTDIVDLANFGPSVLAIVPILGDQNAYRGMIVGGIRISTAGQGELGRIVAWNETISDAGLLLVDSTGRLIFHSKARYAGRDLSSEPPVRMVSAGLSGSIRTRNEEGVEILAGFSPVPGTGWGLVAEENWSALLEANGGYGRFLYLLLALGVIVPALVVFFGVTRITNPISQLIGASKEIAGGKFGQQITVRTGDELEQLAGQFNIMSRELAESYGQLEQRVAARTAELATLNSLAQVVSASLNLKDIMSAALSQALEAMQMETGSAYALEDTEGPDEDRLLVLRAREGLSDDFFRRVGQRRLRGTAMQIAASAQRPTIFLTKDYPDPRLKEALEAEGIEQVINVPLIAKGYLVGAFNVGTRHARVVPPEQISLLASIGHQVAIAVENAMLYERAEQTAALAERNRLSRELHDSVTQSLYSMTLYAEATARLLEAGDVRTATQQVRELRDTAQEALREMRLLIFELRLPILSKSGLVAALQERIDAVERRSGIQCRLRVSGDAQLPLRAQEELYHIAQEALNNSLKHARAAHIQIDLTLSPEQACLEIADDGIGFDPAMSKSNGGLGLRGMQERALRIGGDVDVSSAPGKGTRVTVTARNEE